MLHSPPPPLLTPLVIGTPNSSFKYPSATGAFDEWDYIVNFSDVIHAFTWKLLKVDVLVNVEEDEQFILDWFLAHWDSIDARE
mmetsp:Transcript_12470/g.19847  ORF Transcript_12470/g.19847 Transcript_12470/m.19847 type:complete len:83 (+) Transcript_12470:1-249(+)